MRLCLRSRLSDFMKSLFTKQIALPCEQTHTDYEDDEADCVYKTDWIMFHGLWRSWSPIYQTDWMIFWIDIQAVKDRKAPFTKYLIGCIYKTDCIALWTDTHTDYEDDEADRVYKTDWIMFCGLWRSWSPIYQTDWMIFWIDIQTVKEIKGSIYKIFNRLHLQNRLQ